VREVGSEALVQTLCSHLGPLRALLILDNCEHLTHACAALIDALLRASPTLHVVATSRDVLHIGEQTYHLAPLSCPDVKADLGSVSRSDAARLFVERARLQQRSFALTAQCASAVAEVCIRLDGIPLALELAAARVSLLPVEKIVERLNDRFGLLTGGSRSALPRQQTLRALIAWSFDLLSDAERTAFARLAAFAGGWTLEAAEAVVTQDEISPEQVLDLLSGLVDKSLVIVENNAERYRMLETIREYAHERLQASGEEHAVRERHFAYYAALVDRLEPALPGGAGQKEALDVIDADHDNVRSALTWAFETTERAESALSMFGSLGTFWGRRGYWQEAHAWGVKALAQASKATDKSLRAKALLVASQGKRDLLEDALQLSREAGDRKTEARILNNLARALDWNSDVGLARSLLEQARSINQQTGDKPLELHNISNLVNVLRMQKEHEAARALAQVGLASSRASGDRWNEAAFLYLLGQTAWDGGDMCGAHRLNEQSLEISRELRMPDWQFWALLELGALAVVHGDAELGRQYVAEAFDISRRLGHHEGVGECFGAAAMLASYAGHPDKAARLWGAADTLLQSYLPIWVLHRSEVVRYRTRCRELLGDAAYEAATAAGRALSREAAIDEALPWLLR